MLSGLKLDRRLRELGCELIRQSGSHKHYSNPFHHERIITFPDHPGDVPRMVIEAIVKALGLTHEQFFDPNFKGERMRSN